MRRVSLESFIEFAKKEYGYDILLDENVERDTFEKIFEADFNSWDDFVLEEEKTIHYLNNRMSVSCVFSDEFVVTGDLEFAA